MNLYTAVLVLLVLSAIAAGAIFLGRQADKSAASTSNEAVSEARALRWSSRGLWLVVVLAVVFGFVQGHFARIPNPFEPSAVTQGSPAPGLIYEKREPESIVPPPTNANPTAATERQRELLDEAKRQQRESLGK